MSDTLLNIDDIEVFYGGAQALHGVSLSVSASETLALIGANGAGKSTLLRSICGLSRVRSGDIFFRGRSILNERPNRVTSLGIAMVPEGRRLFSSLSVEENLILGGHVGRPGPWTLDRVYDLFPVLSERRRQPSPSLSGGQQQMVAIGRALMSNPEVLLLDELSLGLAPSVINEIYALLPRIVGEGGCAIIVEQDVTRAMTVSDRFVCLLEGRESLSGASDSLSREDITRAYFGT